MEIRKFFRSIGLKESTSKSALKAEKTKDVRPSEVKVPEGEKAPDACNPSKKTGE